VAAFACDHGTIPLEGAPSGDHAALVAALDRAFSKMKEESGVALVEVSFRGEQRLALQYHMLDDGQKLAAPLKKALPDQSLGAHCLYREPTRELASWPKLDAEAP
jgi:hypothetical protein